MPPRPCRKSAAALLPPSTPPSSAARSHSISMPQPRRPDLRRFPRRLAQALGAVAWLGCVCAAAMPARAADDLFVRIETGEHEAVINAVAALPGGQDFISVSDDKTARIWST